MTFGALIRTDHDWIWLAKLSLFYVFFVPNFSSIGLRFCDCGLAISQTNETVKFDRFWPFDLEILPWTWIAAALATRCFWHFGPRRYVLTWLPALYKKCHLKFFNSTFTRVGQPTISWVYDAIWYDTRRYFNVRSKADMSQLNLPHGTDN